jgi:hypothetical protein
MAGIVVPRWRTSGPTTGRCAPPEKPVKVAIAVSGRRLVTLANALLREDKTFAESRGADQKA